MDGQSFRFEQQNESPAQPQQNDRYNKLQEMLSKAKKNNMDMFYKNLDQQNTYQTEDKFNNKEEFNHYRN